MTNNKIYKVVCRMCHHEDWYEAEELSNACENCGEIGFLSILETKEVYNE